MNTNSDDTSSDDTTVTLSDDPLVVRVQHAVVIQKAADIRALNDLLSVGWHAASSAPMGDAVLVILERIGRPGDVEEMRAALGYSSLVGARTAAGKDQSQDDN